MCSVAQHSRTRATTRPSSREDDGDAHLKNLLVHHQVVVPVTAGHDLGPWQAIFYVEFDGRRPKRLVIKVLGE